jgi:hypothetical protein
MNLHRLKMNTYFRLVWFSRLRARYYVNLDGGTDGRRRTLDVVVYVRGHQVACRALGGDGILHGCSQRRSIDDVTNDHQLVRMVETISSI